MLFKRAFLVSLFFVLAPLFFSCSSSDDEDDENIDFSSCSLTGPNFSISDISGNWVATQANFDIPGTTLQVDIVADGGTVTLNVQSNGGFTLVITPNGSPSETTTGDLAFCEGLFTVRYDDAPNEPETLAGSLNNDVLTITGPVEFDVDDDGSDDEAFVILRFDRV
ncbi:hypothetical protein [Flagellimonas allohymeniacidonis]|uniref:Lipocalin-like domain-containing protein n=1 Tax=Flagellimonas allohymeniacidonis TaxID=2517819 RepID=A0A4Q8QAD3_9FLAO|nr:hypothetical protein [Allomuricauda hymeniacidonis]TAI47262.1 hypothetical protein EW142_11300 [Allomuricauda hymeniacidonis]